MKHKRNIDERLTVRLTKEHSSALERACEIMEISKGELIRRMIDALEERKNVD